MKTPSIKNIMSTLRVDEQTAATVKGLLAGTIAPDNRNYRGYHESHKVGAVLKLISDLTECHGVEYLRAKKDRYSFSQSFGVDYVNAGDMYAATVFYDYTTGRYRLGCLGDFLESPRHAKRFE